MFECLCVKIFMIVFELFGIHNMKKEKHHFWSIGFTFYWCKSTTNDGSLLSVVVNYAYLHRLTYTVQIIKAVTYVGTHIV